MRLDVDPVDYFKALSKKDGIPCQTLINVYLADSPSTSANLPSRGLEGTAELVHDCSLQAQSCQWYSEG